MTQRLFAPAVTRPGVGAVADSYPVAGVSVAFPMLPAEVMRVAREVTERAGSSWWAAPFGGGP